jgi:hypothetical protein
MKQPTKNRLLLGTARERAWKVMRMQRGPFTTGDIARLSEANQENLVHYFYTLTKAGYLSVVGYRSNPPKPGQERLFRLVKNTGPHPPLQKDLDLLYDPNTKEYWAEDPETRLAELGLLPSPSYGRGAGGEGEEVCHDNE